MTDPLQELNTDPDRILGLMRSVVVIIENAGLQGNVAVVAEGGQHLANLVSVLDHALTSSTSALPTDWRRARKLE